jgi:hypothetical protein
VFPRISLANEKTLGYNRGSVVPAGVTVLLGLCNPPHRGCGLSAKPVLLYTLVSISYCGIVFAGVAKQSRLLNK